MPEETKPNDVVEVQKRETVEILTDGKTLSADTPLAAIFDKMEQGKSVEEAANEVANRKVEAPKDEKAEPAKETATPDKEEQAKLEESGLAKQLEADQKKKEEVVTAPEKTEHKADEVPEEELQVLQTDKPKTAKRIQALLERTRKIQEQEALTKKELAARDEKLKQLEEELTKAKSVTVDPATTEAIKQQQEELAMHRRRYLLDKDPEVKSRFDDRIAAAEKPVAEVLLRNGGGESLVKMIEQEGGWLAFSRSNKMVTLKDGQRPAAEVADLILSALPFADRQTIQAVTLEQITTKRERERFFDEEQKKASEYFRKQEEAVKQGTEQHRKQVEEAKQLIQKFRDDTIAKNEWLKEKEIPVDATPEQKAALEDDNKHTKQIRQELDKAIGVNDIPGMLEVVKNAVQFYQERREHARTKAQADAVRAENAKLKAELDRIKNASKTVNRPGSILAANPAKETEKKAPQTLEEAFAVLERAKLEGSDE